MGKFKSQRYTAEVRISQNTIERTFKFTDIGLYLSCDQLQKVCRDLTPQSLCLGPNNC